MLNSFFGVLILIASPASARIQVDEKINLKSKKQIQSKISNNELDLIRRKFAGFINCGRSLSSDSIQAKTPAYRCVNDYLFPEVRDGNTLNYLFWLSGNGSVSEILLCPEDSASLIDLIKTPNSGIFLCFLSRKNSHDSLAIIEFRYHKRDPLIYQIKL